MAAAVVVQSGWRGARPRHCTPCHYPTMQPTYAPAASSTDANKHKRKRAGFINKLNTFVASILGSLALDIGD